MSLIRVSLCSPTGRFYWFYTLKDLFPLRELQEGVLERDRRVVSIFAGLRSQRLVRDFYRALYQEAANNKQQLICM